MESGWRNRIVRTGEERARALVPNPRNWRTHPDAQAAALTGVLQDVGWVQSVVVNQRTGLLVDGHLRVQEAARVDATVPVVYVDLAPEEEALVLATLDPISALAGSDAVLLEQVLSDVRSDSPEVQALLADVARTAGLYAADGPNDSDAGDHLRDIPDELPGALTLKRDMAFPSDLPFELPALRDDRLWQPTADDLTGLTLWTGDDLMTPRSDATYLLNHGTSCRRLAFEQTIYSFYTEDWRFESVWKDPAAWAMRLLNAGVRAVVSPNWSLWADQAQAVRLYSTYRARWTARFFQEAGLLVVPDVNWSKPEDDMFCFAGVPVGAPLLSVQMQTFNPRLPEEVARVRRGLAEALRMLRPEHVLVYAGKAGRELAAQVNETVPMTVLPTLMDARREKFRAVSGLTAPVRGKRKG